MLNKQEIQETLNNHNSIKETAEILNIDHHTLYCFIKKNNLKHNNSKAPIPIDRLKELYEKHQSLSLVAKELGVTKSGVRLAMSRNNIPINKPIRYTFNKDFWSEDNEASFYWAGFWAADGCVYLKNKKYKRVSISLSIKDIDHLEKFKKDIDSDVRINTKLVKNSKYNPKHKDSMACELCFASDKLFDDLARFNIVPRKTKIYTFPKWLKDHKLVNHFMRGYFDGDGSWYFGDNRLRFAVLGTVPFLNTYQEVLNKECDVHLKNIRMRTKEVGCLEHAKKSVLDNIVDYLYKDSTIHLDRKYNLSHQ